MSLPEFFFDRVTADVRRQMDDILALTRQLARQRLAPDAQACVSGVADAAAAVRRLIDGALELRGAVGADDLPLEAGCVPLRALMDEVEDRWRGRAQGAGARLLVSYDGPPDAQVTADRRRLLQVYDGLIGEALAAGRGGAVEASLRARPAGDSVTLEGGVRGGDPDAAADPETRARETAERFGLETALERMLARRIVERLGGRMAEQRMAGGAIAVFALEAPAARETPAPAPRPAGRAAHVLVVDDNATNLTVAQSLCEMFGCSSEPAVDGLEAVQAASGGRFDLILMDIRMPRMDGVAAAREIRKLPAPAGSVPIIALTANADPDDVQDYLAAGMNGVLAKPMKSDELRALLEQIGAGRGEAAA